MSGLFLSLKMEKTFKQIIKGCILKIDKIYFSQDTITDQKTKYGERVFCYEFYHQLRLHQEDFKDLTISGEAVKSNFQFNHLGNNKTPDILIHNFGTIKNNEVVIEVKTSKNKDSVLQGLKKDFLTLDLFTENAHTKIYYKIGIFLLMNFDLLELLNQNEKIKNDVASIIKKNSRIEVWNIPNPIFNDANLLDDSSIKIYTNTELKDIFKNQ